MTQPQPFEVNPEVQVIKASYDLQRRVGSGPLDGKIVKRCEDVIQRNNEDFAPIAHGFLDQLEDGIDQAKDVNVPMLKRLEGMTRPVMELKANAKMFRYDLVTLLANVMLAFLESVSTLDDEAVEIVAAHHLTLGAIIDRRMMGDGGPSGLLLIQELREACNRYFTKRKMRPLNVALV